MREKEQLSEGCILTIVNHLFCKTDFWISFSHSLRKSQSDSPVGTYPMQLSVTGSIPTFAIYSFFFFFDWLCLPRSITWKEK